MALSSSFYKFGKNFTTVFLYSKLFSIGFSESHKIDNYCKFDKYCSSSKDEMLFFLKYSSFNYTRFLKGFKEEISLMDKLSTCNPVKSSNASTLESECPHKLSLVIVL